MSEMNTGRPGKGWERALSYLAVLQHQADISMHERKTACHGPHVCSFFFACTRARVCSAFFATHQMKWSVNRAGALSLRGGLVKEPNRVEPREASFISCYSLLPPSLSIVGSISDAIYALFMEHLDLSA